MMKKSAAGSKKKPARTAAPLPMLFPPGMVPPPWFPAAMEPPRQTRQKKKKKNKQPKSVASVDSLQVKIAEENRIRIFTFWNRLVADALTSLKSFFPSQSTVIKLAIDYVDQINKEDEPDLCKSLMKDFNTSLQPFKEKFKTRDLTLFDPDIKALGDGFSAINLFNMLKETEADLLEEIWDAFELLFMVSEIVCHSPPNALDMISNLMVSMQKTISDEPPKAIATTPTAKRYTGAKKKKGEQPSGIATSDIEKILQNSNHPMFSGPMGEMLRSQMKGKSPEQLLAGMKGVSQQQLMSVYKTMDNVRQGKAETSRIITKMPVKDMMVLLRQSLPKSNSTKPKSVTTPQPNVEMDLLNEIRAMDSDRVQKK